MMLRRTALLGANLGTLLLAGCHHARPHAAVPPPPPVSGPVMVSVPPPTHHSEPLFAEEVTDRIPVVVPVKPPRKVSKRTAPVVALNTAPVQPAVAPTTAPVAPSLGLLTTADENTSGARDRAGQALRAQRDRVAGLPQMVQSTHPSEVDQVRRFLKSATESWNASDYSATLALTTKAKVLLDDVLK